jgi:hypothetical protein
MSYNIAAQLRKPSSTGIVSGPNPTGQGEGDTITRLLPNGALAVSLFDAKGQPATSIIAADSTTTVSFQTGTVPPTITNFPRPGDNGQYYDTVAQKLYIVRNFGGALIYPNFVSIAGSITAAQHGDLSAAGAAAKHAFTQITGAITDTQHGNRGGGSLHDPASGSAAGFMSIGQFNLLAGATSSATASTLVERNGTGGANFAGNLAAVDVDASGHYEVDSVQVVTNRQTGWTAWTGTASRATQVTYTAPTITGPTIAEVQNIANSLQDVSQAFRALLSDLFTHGLLGN